MSRSLFFRVLAEEDKAAALERAVAEVRAGKEQVEGVYAVNPAEFSQIPGSPFAYWSSQRVRRLFRELPPFEGNGRTVKQGLATADDFRFVRTWWEVAPDRIVTGTATTTPEEFRQQTFEGKRWVHFAKGGEYSPYYADLHLVVNWERDGEDVKQHIVQTYPYLKGKWEWVAKNPNYYFRPGLTWPRRTTSGPSFRVLPSGAIFADKGPALFAENLLQWLALMQSAPFTALIELQLAAADDAARSYEVGVMQRCPVPTGLDYDLKELARRQVESGLGRAAQNETTLLFRFPPLARKGLSLTQVLSEWRAEQELIRRQEAVAQGEINRRVLALYGLAEHDLPSSILSLWHDSVASDGEDADESPAVSRAPTLVEDLLSYILGCIFGRWDIRYVTGQRPLPELPDPFAPLPPCPPGMLLGPDGLPARPEHVPEDYPIPIQWDGILPDDEGHPQDLVAQVRRVLAVLFPDRDPAEVEAEACQILGAKDLRAWFTTEFFPYHIKRYSRSRRKAPIYWQLRSAKKSYSLWLYYHRVTADTLWVALRKYVDPKIEHEQARLQDLRQRLEAAKQAGAGREERTLARQVERQAALVEELLQFRADLQAVAELGYEPDRDDGVLINIAPLHRLVPWPEAARMWRELEAGKYPWSTMAKRLQQRRQGGK